MKSEKQKKGARLNLASGLTEERSVSDVEILTKVESCRFLKCGLSTIPKLGIPVIRVGRSVKYLRRDLEAFLLANRQGGGDE